MTVYVALRRVPYESADILAVCSTRRSANRVVSEARRANAWPPDIEGDVERWVVDDLRSAGDPLPGWARKKSPRTRAKDEEVKK
jgi:hypothetical protein